MKRKPRLSTSHLHHPLALALLLCSACAARPAREVLDPLKPAAIDPPARFVFIPDAPSLFAPARVQLSQYALALRPPPAESEVLPDVRRRLALVSLAPPRSLLVGAPGDGAREIVVPPQDALVLRMPRFEREPLSEARARIASALESTLVAPIPILPPPAPWQEKVEPSVLATRDTVK